MDIGGVAVVNLVGEAVLGAEGSLAERRDDFLEGIGVVTEPLAELAAQSLGVACRFGIFQVP
jgi:hypothetical protein